MNKMMDSKLIEIIDQQIEILQAQKAGKTIQWRGKIALGTGEWTDEGMPLNFRDREYRIKPVTLEEAAKTYATINITPGNFSVDLKIKAAVIYGANWREANPKTED